MLERKLPKGRPQVASVLPEDGPDGPVSVAGDVEHRNPAGVPRAPHTRNVLLLCVLVVAAGGCSAPAVREGAAGRAGLAFEAALAAGDHVRACGLLAPSTRRQLEQEEQQDCARALAAERLPRAGALRDATVYGRDAMARMTGDTLFLSLFTDGWRIVAAGCTPEPEKPYRCLVRGA
ncbi:hypothetical protein [Streptomyces sp. NPDC007369]|uniref:hypothetical protein n=1 Tax=Streptomyces sp. NPDC007369 TaxID=3154589 RepID=UPI0033E6F65D